MNHAFLIIAHQYPEQLYRLVISLNSPQSFFYIHVDKKNSTFMDAPEVKKLQLIPNVFFSERIEVYWGGFSQVKATLILLNEVVKNPQIGYFHLLSGVDYPLKSLKDIFSFFDGNDKDYVSYVPEEGKNRYWIDRYYFYDNKFIDARNSNKRTVMDIIYRFLLIFVQKMCAFLVMKLGIRLRRKISMTYYHGSNWFSLSRDAVIYIQSYIQHNSWLLNRFEYTAVSDESFFIMILMNNDERREKIVNNDLRLRRTDGNLFRGGNPLTEVDFDRIKKTTALFGRKFVPGVSDNLITLIEEQIRH